MENYPDYPIDGSSICQSPEDCVKLYETWAATYDDDVKREEYRGPELLVEICLEYLKDKNCKILDFLCGTGVDARLLAQHGYQCIDGIDGSQKMLDHSQQLGLYQNLYLEILHPGVPSKQLRREYYDVLIGVGIFAPGHLQGDFLNHLYEPVKVLFQIDFIFADYKLNCSLQILRW